MWNLLKKGDAACSQFQDALDVSAHVSSGAENIDALLALMPAAQMTHGSACADCRAAAEDMLAVRTMLRQMRQPVAGGDAWFAGRVMASIESREAKWTGPASTWIAVPKLASRLALASFAVLLVGSTWLYQRPRANAGIQPAASASPEYLFEAPQAPITQDDVLVSLAENSQ
jgi:hypothetical protein